MPKVLLKQCGFLQSTQQLIYIMRYGIGIYRFLKAMRASYYVSLFTSCFVCALKHKCKLSNCKKLKSKKFAINSYLMKRKDAMLTFYEEDASSRPQLSSTTNIKCCCWLRFLSVRNVVSVYVYDCACTCNDQRF